MTQQAQELRYGDLEIEEYSDGFGISRAVFSGRHSDLEPICTMQTNTKGDERELAKMFIAAPKMLLLHQIDACLPPRNSHMALKAETLAVQLGYKGDMPIQTFIEEQQRAIIAEATAAVRS